MVSLMYVVRSSDMLYVLQQRIIAANSFVQLSEN